VSNPTLLEIWRGALRDPDFRKRYALPMGVLVVVLPLYPMFLFWIETRPGVPIADPILPHLPHADVSMIAFPIIYVSLFGGLFALRAQPVALALGVQSYGWMIVIRMLMMSLLPLEPPADTIVLRDPFVQLFHADSSPLTRDLFFSGHTATLTLVALRQTHPRLRWLFGVLAASLGPLLMIQRAHYSIDVAAAPFFAFCACRLADRVSHRRGT